MAPLTGTSPARPDTEVVFDPATYTAGVPFEALARLRRETPVAWVPEIPVLGWPEGPGFWLALGHAEHVGQGEQGQVSGYVLGEVAFAARAGEHAVADGPGMTADAVLKPDDRPRRE